MRPVTLKICQKGNETQQRRKVDAAELASAIKTAKTLAARAAGAARSESEPIIINHEKFARCVSPPPPTIFQTFDQNLLLGNILNNITEPPLRPKPLPRLSARDVCREPRRLSPEELEIRQMKATKRSLYAKINLVEAKLSSLEGQLSMSKKANELATREAAIKEMEDELAKSAANIASRREVVQIDEKRIFDIFTAH